MITRSKLVEQLRDYQVRSHHKFYPLAVFSPKPFLSTSKDVEVAIIWTLVFIDLLILSYVTLYFQYYWITFIALCLGILVPVRLRNSRHSSKKERDRKLLLPLSM